MFIYIFNLKKIIFTTCCFSVFISGGLCADTRLPVTAGYHLYPHELMGSALTVYKDYADTNKYFYAPYFRADWEHFDNDVQDACKASTPDEVQDVSLKFEMSSRSVSREVAARASEKEGKNVSESQIFSYPYKIFKLKITKNKNSSKTIWQYPPLINNEIDVNDSLYTEILTRSFNASFQDTCVSLKYLSRNKNINMYMYSPYSDIEVNNAMISYSDSFSTDVVDQLDRMEGQSGSITVSQNSSSTNGVLSGLGINIFSNESNHTVDQTDGRQRYVSENLLQEAAHEAVSRLNVKTVTEKAGESMKDYINEVITFVLNNSQKQRVYYKEVDANQYNIKLKSLERSINQKDVIKKLSSSESHKIASHEKAGAARASGERDSSNDSASSVELEKGGEGDWIPTDIYTYLISENKFSTDFESKFENLFISKGKGLQRKLLSKVIIECDKILANNEYEYQQCNTKNKKIKTEIDKLNKNIQSKCKTTIRTHDSTIKVADNIWCHNCSRGFVVGTLCPNGAKRIRARVNKLDGAGECGVAFKSSDPKDCTIKLRIGSPLFSTTECRVFVDVRRTESIPEPRDCKILRKQLAEQKSALNKLVSCSQALLPNECSSPVKIRTLGNLGTAGKTSYE